MTIHSYYFTFGTDERFPYQTGYVIIDAPNERCARDIFRMFWPDRHENCLNCAFVYEEDEFMRSICAKEPCHAQIRFTETEA